MSLLRAVPQVARVGATELISTLMRRQVGEPVAPPGVADLPMAKGAPNQQQQVWVGGGSAPAVPVAPAAAPAPSPAPQQLSADERLRALQNLQRIVASVAAEQPTLGGGGEVGTAEQAAAAVGGSRKRRYDPDNEDPVEEERVAVWNQVTGKKLTGQAAPKRKCAAHPPAHAHAPAPSTTSARPCTVPVCRRRRVVCAGPSPWHRGPTADPRANLLASLCRNLDKYLRQHPDFAVLYEDGAPSAAAAAAAAAAAHAQSNGDGDSSAQQAPAKRTCIEGLHPRPKSFIAVTPPLVPTVFEPLPSAGKYEQLSPLLGKGTPDFGIFDSGFRL